MHINVKFPNFNLELDVEDGATVEQLRALCAEKTSSNPAGLCLVYKGKIMKDKDKLSEIEVVDGCSVHCAYRKVTANEPPKTTPVVSQPVESVSQTPLPTLNIPTSQSATAGIPGNLFGNLDLQSASNIMKMLSDSPELARLFTDPSFIEAMISMDPRLKSLMESYPEIGQAMRNPDVLRQIAEIMRSPAAMQEMARSQERFLTNLSNTPNGLNQYFRLFNDMNRAAPTSNPQSTSAASSRVGGMTTQSDSSNANVSGEAMPNPWSTGANIPSTSSLPSQGLASSSAATSQSQAQDSALFRDVVRILRLSNAEQSRSTQILDRIRALIDILSPRGQYGLTELLKGMEVIKEECPELVLFLLNYQLSTIRLMTGEEDVATMPAANEEIPPEAGNETSYISQLEELKMMGFTNHEENMDALRHSYGDVNGAVDWILRRRGVQ